jgi:hypothetical protein
MAFHLSRFFGKYGWLTIPVVLVMSLFSLLRGMTQPSQPASNSMQGICLDSLLPKRPNSDFGYALAIGDGVAAVSEPSAERVHVFRVRGKRWFTTNLITNPDLGGSINSQPRSVGHGFGNGLALWNQQLVVGDFVASPDNRPTSPSGSLLRRSAVWSIDLSTPQMLPQPLFHGSLPANVSYGYAVAINEHHIAASFRPIQPSGGKAGVAWVHRRASGRVELLMSPNPSADFGHHITLDGYRLLVSDAGTGPNGTAWLLNLNQGGFRRLLEQENLPPDFFIGATAFSGNLVALGGRRNAPTISAAAIARLDPSGGKTVQIIRPGGAIAATATHIIVAPAAPMSLGRSLMPEPVSDLPSLIVVGKTGEPRPITLRHPLSGKPIRDVQALTAGYGWLLLTQRQQPCAVLVFSTAVLGH